MVLGGADYYVRAAEDGVSALRILEAFHPDAIVLDLRLPSASGFEVVHEVRHTLGMRHLPIIATSGDERGVELATANPEFFAVLVKPFAPEVLVDAVDAALRMREVHEKAGLV